MQKLPPWTPGCTRESVGSFALNSSLREDFHDITQTWRPSFFGLGWSNNPFLREVYSCWKCERQAAGQVQKIWEPWLIVPSWSNKNDLAVSTSERTLSRILGGKESGRHLTQSYDKSPYTSRKSETHQKNCHRNFDYTTIADRLRTVRWRKRKRSDSVLWNTNPYNNRKFQKAKWQDNTKRHQKRLRTYLGQSVGITTATQLVLLNRFTGFQPSYSPQKLCNQKDTHLKICN